MTPDQRAAIVIGGIHGAERVAELNGGEINDSLVEATVKLVVDREFKLAYLMNVMIMASGKGLVDKLIEHVDPWFEENIARHKHAHKGAEAMLETLVANTIAATEAMIKSVFGSDLGAHN